MNNKQLIIDLLMTGHDIEYKGVLSISDITNHYGCKHLKDSRWQVHSEDYHTKHSELYNNIDTAVVKFLELRRKIK